MKFIKIITLAVLFSLPLLANDSPSYILITKTSKEGNLKHIKKKLDSLDVKMYTRKSGKYYMVYSQKYKNKKYLNAAYKRVKSSFHTATIVTKKRTQEATNISNANNMFVSFGLGNSGVNGTTDDVSVSQMSSSSLSFSVEAGYYFNKNVFLSLAYLNASTNEISIHNAYSSINYELNFLKDFSAYAGVLVGIGTLQLTAYDASEPSMSIIFGGQAGLGYKVYNNLSVYASVQVLSMSHSIKLLETSTEATFDSINNMQLGLRYRF